ncbi:MAG TPA: flavodoxin family protein, partial [Candidatus Brocadiia bacterium]|nr:flavodoxin family protein [Candidatus Brocadiia bacterium]
AGQGAEVESVRLADKRVLDCVGCLRCLKEGRCVLDDDVAEIMAGMKEADGLVVGSPVRNGMTTACYKRFYERITYLLGFTLALADKYVLAVSSVGFMGGRGVCRTLLGFQGVFHARLSGHEHFRVGIPARVTMDQARPRLERAADRLMGDIQSKKGRGLAGRLTLWLDRVTVARFMLRKNPETYAHVIEEWKKKGYW